MNVTLQLLGTPRYWRQDAWLELPVRQPLLLGSYLVCRDDWVSRDRILGLLWPDEDEKTARHNLSQLLYTTRRQPWAEGLEVTRSRLRWRVASDVRAFREALGNGAWGDAAGLHRHELLSGVTAAEHPAFDAWLESEREELRSAWRDAALRHAANAEAAGHTTEASGLLSEVLRRDPLAEEALQGYLRMAPAAGQRERALDAYERFVLPHHEVSEVIVSGGGVHNRTLMGRLAERLAPLPVRPLDELGLSSDAKEAVAFAILANETIAGNPGNVPRATGARRPVVLGKLVP